MKRLTTTKFFIALHDITQKDISIDAQVLKKCYDEFVMLLFSQSAAFSGKAAFHNTLEYTRVELTSLTEEVSEKKCTCFTEKGYSSSWQTTWMDEKTTVSRKEHVRLSVQKTGFIQNRLEMDCPQNISDWTDVWIECNRQFQFG